MSENENSMDSSAEPEPKRKRISPTKLFKYLTIIALAFTVGYIHYRYVSHLFENDRNFSYLSEMERELSLHSEMAFYYSYFKTVVQERPFMAAITKLMNDRLVEYPNEVNAFNRFNIHPEIIIGVLYRYFEPILNTTTYRQCHIVERDGLSPVESCVGLGQPIMFYLEAVWVLAGLNVAALFLLATAVSDSILGGLLAVIQYFANHADSTRVQWAPNERENMAAPLILLQLWLVSLQLRDRERRTTLQLQVVPHGVQRAPNERENMAAPLILLQLWLVSLQLRDRERRTTLQLQVAIFILNSLCLLFWQFSQFIFLTQLAIFFVMEQLRIIDLKTLCILLHSHFCGLHLAVLLLQGNDMLKSSLYTSLFIVLSAYCLFFSSLCIKVESRMDLYVESWLVVLRICIVACSSIYLKKIISDFLLVNEDSHVWDILRSKFTDFKNFHTQLYTCSDVFDFLPLDTVINLFLSLLIPFVIVSIANVLKTWLSNAIQKYRKEMKGVIEKDKKTDIDSNTSDEDSGIENTEVKAQADLNLVNMKISSKVEKDKLLCFLRNLTIEPAVFYNISQMVVYGVMAVLVMRLKLLFVPQMCVVSALMMNKSYYKLPKKYVTFFWLISLLPVLQTLIENVTEEMSHIGEFSDPDQEKLMEWIMSESSTSVFAGSLPLLASIMLVTRRAIVAHPHYEHEQARQRAYTVYKMYGPFSAEEYYDELSKLRVTHLVVEAKYCYGKSSKGCSLPSIWRNSGGGDALCRALLGGRAARLYPLYRDRSRVVLRLHDYSVRYMPRSFDS